jgi:hypothetical protein
MPKRATKAKRIKHDKGQPQRHLSRIPDVQQRSTATGGVPNVSGIVHGSPHAAQTGPLTHPRGVRDEVETLGQSCTQSLSVLLAVSLMHLFCAARRPPVHFPLP